MTELNRISDAIAKNPHLHVEIFRILKEDGVRFRQQDDGVSMDLSSASPNCLKEITMIVTDSQEDLKSPKCILDPLQEKLRKRMRDLHRRMSQHKRSAPSKEKDDENMMITAEDGLAACIEDDLALDKDVEDNEPDPDLENMNEDPEQEDDIDEERNPIDDETDDDENDIDIEDIEAPLIEVDEGDNTDNDEDKDASETIEDEMESTIHRDELASIDTKAFTLPSAVKSKTMKELLYQYKLSMKDLHFGTDEEFEDFVNHVSPESIL